MPYYSQWANMQKNENFSKFYVLISNTVIFVFYFKYTIIKKSEIIN